MGLPEGSPYCRVSTFEWGSGFAYRPSLHTLTHHSVGARTLRFCVMPYVNVVRWYGNVDPFSIAYAFRPRLRTRLTLFRLTLNRNPWAYGGPVSHGSYRYSYLHFLFQKLHCLRFGLVPKTLTGPLLCRWNAPLPLVVVKPPIRSFGVRLDAREFSMPDRSISELLRTL